MVEAGLSRLHLRGGSFELLAGLLQGGRPLLPKYTLPFPLPLQLKCYTYMLQIFTTSIAGHWGEGLINDKAYWTITKLGFLSI